MSECIPDNHQKWIFEYAGNGYFKMKTKELKNQIIA